MNKVNSTTCLSEQYPTTEIKNPVKMYLKSLGNSARIPVAGRTKSFKGLKSRYMNKSVVMPNIPSVNT